MARVEISSRLLPYGEILKVVSNMIEEDIQFNVDIAPGLELYEI